MLINWVFGRIPSSEMEIRDHERKRILKKLNSLKNKTIDSSVRHGVRESIDLISRMQNPKIALTKKNKI